MDSRKKPNIKIPEGFELFFNSITGNWALRPIKGYSAKYIRKDTFVPKQVNESIKNENNIDGKGKNKNLSKARNRKNDEFYTRLEDITSEMKHYKQHFSGKVIYCPCDKLFNVGRSNFGRYFLGKFHSLGIKKLICTQYNPNGFGIATEYDFEKCGIEWEYNGEKADGDFIDESEIDTYFLKGDGSFDSPECREIMKNCDIVITNPPFSLFRKFIAQIMEFNKKFIILGNMNALTYKEVFPLIKENKIWLGYRNLGSDMFFEITDEYKKVIVKEKKEGSGWKEIDGEIMGRVANACWYTNLEHTKRKEKIYLEKTYNPTDYPKYDNYDAINVNRIEDIPKDYDGIMGVPITYLGKYNPNQFEIVGIMSGAKGKTFTNGDDGRAKFYLNGKGVYARILIRKITELPTEE